MNGQIVAGPPALFVYLLGGVVAVLTSAVAVNSFWVLVRRIKGEKRFVSLVALNLRDGERFHIHMDSALLERASEGKLDEADRQRLSPVLYATLEELIPEYREPIRRALKQPSDKGRANYESRILSESVRQAWQALEKTNDVGRADRTAGESYRSEAHPPDKPGSRALQGDPYPPAEHQLDKGAVEVMKETPERIEREMFEIRSRMAPDVRDLKKHAEPQATVKERVRDTLARFARSLKESPVGKRR